MYKMMICTKYHLFRKNMMKTITNNNLPWCNMKQHADFKFFAIAYQGKQYNGDFRSEVLNWSANNATLRARSNANSAWV